MTKEPRHSPQKDRALKVKVKTAKGRKIASTRWLERQLNDPYARQAKKDGYRSRAAYKLLEMDDKLSFLKPGMKILDLGSAPGGWSQAAAARVNATGANKRLRTGSVWSLDLQPIDPIECVTFLKLDFLDTEAPDIIKEALQGSVDVVLSDMAPPASGHRQTDHLRIMGLCEAVTFLAVEILTSQGTLIIKIRQGSEEKQLLQHLKSRFKKVRYVKPSASRSDSSEMYIVATQFQSDT